MKDYHRNRSIAAIAATVLLVLSIPGCTDPLAPGPLDIGRLRQAKGGTPATAGASVMQGDLALADADAPALTSSCPSTGFTPNAWAVVFGKSGCLVVTPLWASATYTEYALTDDVVLQVQLENGKNGRITHMRLNAQDVDGEAGIWHNTDWIAVAQPVVPTKAGFTLHVHAKNVAVWRYNSHLGDGNRVEIIGTVSIGDVVYPQQ
ncbi:MAG TPA: hypothetical protein VES88_04360 [Gemmatimonadaceae bacterium]|nr:hypothetical protein [Gemmatimonadaceae bacterium]